MAFSFGGQSSPAQASQGFSFGSTPAASGGLFGSSSFSFGASNPAQSTPSFGNPFAQPASTPGFGGGVAASSAPGLFGSATSAFSFSTPSLFGSSSQPASAPSLFGSTPAMGAFGVSQPAGQPGLASGFGNPQSQLAPAGFSAGLPNQPDFSALKELEAIASAYNPGSSRFRFNHLFLNVVDHPGARVKPADVDELQWRAALQQAGGPENPDRLWPVQAKGFRDLIARKNAQDEAIKEHATRLEAAEHASRQLARKQETLLRERIESVRRKHFELSHMLLRIMRHIDALEGRFAASQNVWDAQSQEVVAQLAQALQSLEAAIAPTAAGGLQRQVEALATAARLREGAPGLQSDVPRLDDSSLASIFGVLQQQADALGRLQDVLRRDDRDLAILEETAPQNVHG